MTPNLKPAYLVHGDDHGRVAERRAGLRRLAEAQSGAGGVELLEGDAAGPRAVAGVLCAMTLAVGRRFVIVDGVERWRAADVEVVAPALASLPPDTTVAFFGRDEGRLKVPPQLAEAVRAAGGDVRVEALVKPWELPRWVVARAADAGGEISPAAARALVRQVGERQQRLLRELEKLALGVPAGTRLEVEHVEALAAASAERRTWALADALVAGDGPAAASAYLGLRRQGERLTGLLFALAQRLRTAQDVAGRLEAGQAPARVRASLRMPPKAAERLIADVGRTDAGALGDALADLADLELASRGGAPGPPAEDTAALRAIARLTG